MRAACLAVFGAFLIASGANAQPADTTTIRRLDSLWASMYARHDTATALALYAQDLSFTSANGARKTLQQEMGDIRPQPGLVMDYFRTTPSSIAVTGDTAVVSGAAEWRFTWGGAPRTIRRDYVATYRRGGTLGWRIVAVRMLST